MHTRIVFQAAQALLQSGLPVLRFNFRGVGKSAGTHDRGVGEQADIAAAMAYMRSQYPLPLVLAGFSFGAATLVRLLVRQAPAEVERVVLMGLPLGRGAPPAAWAWQGPKLMISGDHDAFAPVEELEAYYAALPEPKARVWIAGGDHFMAGKSEEFRGALAAHLD